jgi:hypothetical protein
MANKEENCELANNWRYLKTEINETLLHMKQQLTEERELGLLITQLSTEGYIQALDWVLFVMENLKKE